MPADAHLASYLERGQHCMDAQSGYDWRMNHELGNQESAPYNLRTNFDATKEAMAYVEQGGWLHSEDRIAKRWDEASEGEQGHSLEGARRWLDRIDPSVDMRRTVYGDGGINRWYVHADGGIWFSRSHASPPGLLRAQEKGFQID